MAEFQSSLSAPWRMKYLATMAGPAAAGDCFLCRYAATPDADEVNHVLWRTPRTLVLLNLFPYTNGHVLVAPTAHAAALEAFALPTLTELTARVRDAVRVLRASVRAEGFNIGMNVGGCAGAGLPDHLHWHIVPRWSGDTNFMGVVGDARVVPQELATVAAAFAEQARALGLPAAM